MNKVRTMPGCCHRLITPGHFRRPLLRTLLDEAAGAELFEFALVIPLLLALILGIIWIGRAYNVYETITRAAREGVRYAVLPNCATCGDTLPYTYATAGACAVTSPSASAIFPNYIQPVLQASSLNPSAVTNYCEEAVVLDPNTDPSVQQCGVRISFQYPVQLAIPFTSVNATTINFSTQVQMRMENQSVNSATGAPDCPGDE
ncbi:MAG: TadE/TadG family type IV pilus assembly protein [Terriglobia bacterium]